MRSLLDRRKRAKSGCCVFAEEKVDELSARLEHFFKNPLEMPCAGDFKFQRHEHEQP
jgi:hypothetical protein